ncbi:DNA polymerase [Squirrelpox virus]|uniref:DNA polymerase n=1 Tax=Squirrelpox virus TaxID=240426 RepID=U3UBH8_9POXV|nr:DNA polymerase [Squirrelpox virus]CCD83215.1 DNA polymerase [Squirrelpox virus]
MKIYSANKMDVKCVNWFESRGERKYLYLKARTREGAAVYFRFNRYFYYVVSEATLASLAPPAHRAEPLGRMSIIDIDEEVSRDANLRPRPRREEDLWLVAEPHRRSIVGAYMTDFLDVTWFFIANEIDPCGCYAVDESLLEEVRAGCFHCEDPKRCFAARIPRFDVQRTYLFMDIECHFEKKFPSVFTNPVSHVSCCTVDRTGAEFRFTLLNEEMLSEADRAEALRRGCVRARSATEADLSREVVLCSEVVMLQITRLLIESAFDFVVTFNGHNFDLRYVANRLELLTGESVTFRLPDHSETVKLCIYERNLLSHRGQGGVANTTYHVNNNNGTIFFDLYAYIQKSEKLDSYKLDSISKNAFHCRARVTEAVGDCCVFEGDDAPSRVRAFAEVLSTGNYITIADGVYKVLEKRVADGRFELRVRFGAAAGETHELSFGKDDVDLAAMYRDYDLDVALEMARYCVHDASLCKYLWHFYGMETKTDAAAATYLLPHCLAFEYRASTLIKGPLLRMMLEQRKVFVRNARKTKFLYEGGKVFAPRKKMFENNVAVFDYNSLYPNVCIFGNLSPETLVGVMVSGNRLEAEINAQELRRRYRPPRFLCIECEPRSHDFVNEVAVFDREAEGVIPMLLRSFLDRRAEYKKLMKSASGPIERGIYDSMQYTCKIVANSVYGLMGFRNSALYSYASAKSCTTIGRRMITYLDSVMDGAAVCGGEVLLAAPPLNPFFDDGRDQSAAVAIDVDPSVAMNLRTVYGDTDSVFVEMSTKDVAVTQRVARELERVINQRVLFANFRVEFEAVYSRLIMQSKKKYTTMKFAAGSVADPERVSKGTSETRRDVSRFHKEMIKSYKTRLTDMLSEGGLSSQAVCVSVLQSLEQDMRLEFERRALPLEMFLLSRTHHCNFKSPDNPNMALVMRYNSENPEVIEIGERYFFAYFCDAALPWQRRLENVKSHERIVDRGFRLGADQRIFYEVYFKRLATEVVNLLDHRELSVQFFTRLFGTRPLFYD